MYSGTEFALIWGEIYYVQKFLRHLLEITKLGKEKNQCIRGKKGGAQNIVKEIKEVRGKVATTRTEDGHK